MRAKWFLVFVIGITMGTGAAKTPILIIPGFTGSQLDGIVTGGPCASQKPRTLWVDLKALNCSTELELSYNTATNTYSDRSGVSVTVPGFGSTSTVECLMNASVICQKNTSIQYFNLFVDYFVARGYQRGMDIRAAPYDWRLAADSLSKQGYFKQLRKLVEEMYKDSGEGVALVVHSMGGPMSLYFLNEVVTQEWKDKYIKVYIPLSGAFAGASGAVEAVVSGSLHSVFVTKLSLQRSFEALYWLMPRGDIFKDQVLVQTPTTNYTAGDYEKLFEKANYPLGWIKYKPTVAIMPNLTFPGVPTFCFYGSDIPTALMFKFSGENVYEKPTVVMGGGDGSVNKVSLEACLLWSGRAGFHSRSFSGIRHNDMVRDESVLKAIEEIVMTGRL